MRCIVSFIVCLTISAGLRAAEPGIRPQDPKPPYPYRSEEVAFENHKAGIKLAGTLTLPKGDGPFPAVILISGSGPQDRDAAVMGHRPFRVLADHLTRTGIAVLRYDDRGVAKSTGIHAGATSLDFAQDVIAALTYLSNRKEIQREKIGLIGHSEGGLIGPIVAAELKEVAFLVLLAGPGVPGESILCSQVEAIAQANEEDEELVAARVAIQKKVLAQAKKGANAAALMKVYKEQIGSLPRDLQPSFGHDEIAQSELTLNTLAGPWLKYFLTHDPYQTLKRVHCPVLALNGERDTQVLPHPNLLAIESALTQGGNKDVTVRELHKLNHLFQSCRSGSPSEYARLEETFAPVALDLITGWITQRVTR